MITGIKEVRAEVVSIIEHNFVRFMVWLDADDPYHPEARPWLFAASRTMLGPLSALQKMQLLRDTVNEVVACAERYAEHATPRAREILVGNAFGND